MPRLYFTSDSYPELRDVNSRWRRSVVWWRAIRHAVQHIDFWWFAAGQVAAFLLIAATGLGLTALTGWSPWLGIAFATAAIVFGYFQVSWGGDMMRRHLREVSHVAREACPRCGHSLRGHRAASSDAVRCSECGLVVEPALFLTPFPLPREVLAFPIANDLSRGRRKAAPNGKPDMPGTPR